MGMHTMSKDLKDAGWTDGMRRTVKAGQQVKRIMHILSGQMDIRDLQGESRGKQD